MDGKHRQAAPIKPRVNMSYCHHLGAELNALSSSSRPAIRGGGKGDSGV
jgi:hypothetical protein